MDSVLDFLKLLAQAVFGGRSKCLAVGADKSYGRNLLSGGFDLISFVVGLSSGCSDSIIFKSSYCNEKIFKLKNFPGIFSEICTNQEKMKWSFSYEKVEYMKYMRIEMYNSHFEGKVSWILWYTKRYEEKLQKFNLHPKDCTSIYVTKMTPYWELGGSRQ